MENLVFSLNATLPIFFTMALGWFFRRVRLFNDEMVSGLNKFVFKAALPVLLFEDLSTVDLSEAWDTRFVIFCFCVTAISILLVTLISYLFRDHSIQGEFIQAAYRSSAAILGLAFIQNLYGNSGMAPLMIIASVPLYNIMAVVVLSVMKPEREPLNGALIRKTLLGILTNPIILGILAGLLWSATGITMPAIATKTLKNVSCLATPLGLMAMGASFDLKKAKAKAAPAFVAAAIKLIGLAALFLPLAIHLGFRTEKLIAILVMLGSSTTVSSFIMAKNMGHEGTVTSSAVMLTTLGSAFTLTFWLWLIKTLGLI